RRALLDFIADFANWDNSNVREYLDTSRALTQAAHEALGGAPGTRPLVVDPFAGGGSIPFEALRVGADAFASDLNPVPVLLKKDKRSVAFQLVPNKKAKRVDFQIIVRERDGWIDQANSNIKIESPNFEGTVKRGSATCRCCGYTTPVRRVREQLKARRGGAND